MKQNKDQVHQKHNTLTAVWGCAGYASSCSISVLIATDTDAVPDDGEYMAVTFSSMRDCTVRTPAGDKNSKDRELGSVNNINNTNYRCEHRSEKGRRTTL